MIFEEVRQGFHGTEKPIYFKRRPNNSSIGIWDSITSLSSNTFKIIVVVFRFQMIPASELNHSRNQKTFGKWFFNSEVKSWDENETNDLIL